MKTVSFWAKQHEKLSWFLITLFQFCLYFIAAYSGYYFFTLGFKTPGFIGITAIMFLLLGFLFYPKRNKKNYTFFRHKIFDVSIGIFTFILVFFIYNDEERITSFNNYNSLNGSFGIEKFEVKKESSLPITKKQARAKFKELKKQLKASGNKITAGQILTLILLLSVSVFLLVFVAALSCSLVCNGAEALAVIVGIGGVFAVIWFAKYFIKKIFHSK